MWPVESIISSPSVTKKLSLGSPKQKTKAYTSFSLAFLYLAFRLHWSWICWVAISTCSHWWTFYRLICYWDSYSRLLTWFVWQAKYSCFVKVAVSVLFSSQNDVQKALSFYSQIMNTESRICSNLKVSLLCLGYLSWNKCFDSCLEQQPWIMSSSQLCADNE